jgi:thermopsin/copper-binding protein NosD
MALSPLGRKGLWLLPIVLVVCALMVVPAGAATQTRALQPAASGATAAVSSGGSLGVPTIGATSGSSANALSSVLGSHSLSSSSGQPTIPSAAPATSNALSNVLSQLEAKGAKPTTLALVQRIASGVQSGSIPASAAILPNLNVLLGNSASHSSVISQYYTQAPAPMGIADVGLGATPYEYNTSSIVGTANLTSYNATAGSLYEPSGQYYWNGNPANEPGNPYDSGMQLNTVVWNVTYPGSTSEPLGSGVFWTQNVPEWSGNSIQFLDNVWNFSAPGASMTPGTIYSASGVLVPYDFYYDYGPTVPVVYPMSLQLYNNASIIDGRSAISYGYRLADGNGMVYTGTYDTIIFNSPSPPTIQPQFQVNGFNDAPYGAAFDSELVFCGPAAGSNAVITNVSGALTLRYLPTGSATWKSVPSAYDYGQNTGETAIGVAGYWSGTTEYINQGPSLLYGLWGTPSGVGVPSGSIQFTGHATPNYAFTFIGETIGGLAEYPEWAPSNALGVVSTWLPPSIPGSTAYSVTAFAAEYADYTGTSFTTAQTNYAVSMTSSPGNLDAPLYMNGEAQATALVTAVDGSAVAPYTFKNLVDNIGSDLGLPFNLLNDWGYPVFNLFWSTGVTTKLVVNNVAQGPNFLGDTLYFYPYFGGSYDNYPNASQEFVDYGGVGDSFVNLYLPGFLTGIGVITGGAISLWGTSGVLVNNISSTDDSFGVWASVATDTTVENSNATYGAAAFSVIASSGAVGWNVSAYDEATAIYDEGGTGGTFTYLNVSDYADGVYGYWANGTTANNVRAWNHADGVYEEYGIGLKMTGTTVTSDSYGLFGLSVNDTTVTTMTASVGSDGVYMEGGSTATISGVSANDSEGVVLLDLFTTATISNVVAVNDSLGVGLADGVTGATITTVSASDLGTFGGSVGVILEDDAMASSSVTGVTATGSSSPLSESIGVEVEGGSSDIQVSTVAASTDAIGVGIVDSTDVTVSGVTATNDAAGVVVDPSSGITISGVTASNIGIGTEIESSSNISISGTAASDMAIGDYIVESSQVTDTGASATGGNATGVYLDDTTFTSVSDVTATSTAMLGVYQGFESIPAAGVVTEDTSTTSVSNVTATGYGAGLYDLSSTGLQVSDVNNTGGQYAVVLNDTFNGYLNGVGAFQDWIGVLIQDDAEENWISGSSFVDDTSFGVAILYGYDNYVVGNNFIGDNGATNTYSAAHVQAWSDEYNYFYTCTGFCTTGTGNYWADWHTYGANGYLAPYIVTGESQDLFPTGPQEMFTVNFVATGLPTGTSWSVTFGGAMQTATGAISFQETMGTYAYQVGSVTGYTSSPTSGSVTLGDSNYNVTVAFTAVPVPTYAVTLSAGGLASGTTWSASVGTDTQSTSGLTLVWYLPAGTYNYTFNAVSGYHLPSTGATGSAVVTNVPMSLSASYTPNTTTSYVSTDTFNTWLAVAFAIAVIALVIALLAVMMRRRRDEQPSQPAQAWTPPPAGSTDASAGTAGGTSGNWSEGPPAGGSPPS